MTENHESVPSPQRPLPLTIVAIVIAVSYIAVPFVVFELAPIFLMRYGAWYVAMWIVSLIATGSLAVSYWRMERWGLYFYTGMFIAGTVVGILTDVQFTVAGVLVPALIIAIGFIYFPRLR